MTSTTIAGPLVIAAACSLVVEADKQQCLVSSDCVGHQLSPLATCIANVCVEPTTSIDAGVDADAAPVDPIWGCIGKVAFPKIEPSVPIRFQWRFLSALAEEPIKGVHFEACGGLDTGCTDPIAGTSGETSDDGVMDVPLYRGFRGYLNLTPSGTTNIKPALFYFRPPANDVLVGPFETQAHLLSEAEFTYVVQSLGVKVNPELGNVFGLAFDCQGNPASGVSVVAGIIAPETAAYYTDENRTPSLTQQKTGTRAEAGFINLPVGSATLTYTRNGGQPIGSVNVLVRAGRITFAPLYPSP